MAAVSAWVGDQTGAGIIVTIVLIGIVINFVQTYRSSRAIRRLREGVAVTATVSRDGVWCEVPRREVVPGDVIRLCAGDLVPADARILISRDLHVQQAALTGESLPVEKEVAATPVEAPPKPADRDAVFFGTSVVSGTSAALVVATGPATIFGTVARHVCGQVGLGGRVVLGDEIDGMNDSALGQVAEEAAVFARLSPNQKNRIILALKARGHVVGFLGDGVNDAPSLRAADVGVTVSTAVDVAKDAAEVVLLEPGLGALHTGIREGRRAFGNVMKYLLMGTSSNFGNVLSMAAATGFLRFLPMLPMQILLNSLLQDLAQLTIPTDRVDPSYLHKPRRWDVGLIRRFMLVIGPVSSLFDFLTFFVLLHLFRAGEALFHTGWFVESLATQTLVLFVIRTGGNPFRSRPSRALTVTILTISLVGILLPYSPLAGPLGFVPLPVHYLLFVFAATGVYLALMELIKRHLLRHVLA